jgi:hypothetical protein
MSMPDPEALSALGRTVERAVRRLGAVEATMAELAAGVEALAERLEETEVAGLRSWLAADDPGQAREDLAELAGWLGAVYLRYPGAALPTCWLWHPAAVEELWWLRQAHHDAYEGPFASWARVADWHDRARPGVVRRLDAAIGACELSEHADGGREDRPAPAVPLADAAAVIAGWWAATDRRGTPPAPSPEQLDQAEAHQKANHR